MHLNIDGEDAEKVKEVMESEDLPWRTFVDKGDIAATWKPPGTPTFYILDPQGAIRHKWAGAPGERVIRDAVVKLLREASAQDNDK